MNTREVAYLAWGQNDRVATRVVTNKAGAPPPAPRDTSVMQLLEVPFARVTVLALAVALASWGLRPAAEAVEEDEPRGRVVVTETETTILDVVEFEPGTATIRAKSTAILDAVAATMQGNPSIELVEVQAHTCGAGDEVANLALTQRRAEAVVAYLVAAGVAPVRLDPQGYGDTQPIVPEVSAKNERIAFLILKRSSDY